MPPKKVAAVRDASTPEPPAEQKSAPPTKSRSDCREIQRRTRIAADYQLLKQGKRHGRLYRNRQEAEKAILSPL